MSVKDEQYYTDIISALATQTIKRLYIIIILLVILLFGSNLAWIVYEKQFADESWSYSAEADDNSNAVINGEGEVYIYGSESDSDAQEEAP